MIASLRNFLSILIVVFFASFSGGSYATTFFTNSNYLGPSASSQCFQDIASVCAAIAAYRGCGSTVNGTGACNVESYNPSPHQCLGTMNVVSMNTGCSTACPSGQMRSTSTGLCISQPTCTVAGQINDPATGVCVCPSGQEKDTGSDSDILSDYAAQCKTPADRCARRSGQSFNTFSPTMSVDGCAVTCVIGPAFEMNDKAYMTYNCKYTGAVSGPAGADPNKDKADTPVPIPSVPSLPIPPVWYPEPAGGCAAGDAKGSINGQNACVPQSKPDGTANVPTSTASNTQSQTTVTNTSTQTNSDGSTTTVSTTTTTIVGGTSSGSGSGTGTGTGTGTGSGAGDCDPTASNYFQCAGLVESVDANKAQQIVDQLNTTGSSQLDSYGNAVDQNRDDATTIESPDGVSSSLLEIIPDVGACSDVSFNFMGHIYVISCSQTSPIRYWAAWVFYVLTAYTVFNIAFERKGA